MHKPPLTDVTYLKSLMHDIGSAPKKSMGQNFLICSEVVDAAITVLEEGPQNVTELGAGIGTLTQALAAHDFTVRSIEKDDAVLPILKKHIPNTVEIVHEDLKDVAWEWDTPYQVAGNIPYNLTGLIVRRITELDPAPMQAVLLMQQEVAERILAKPGDMSLISLATQLWGTAHHVLTVPRNCFWPQPKVTSTLLLFTPHAQPHPNREDILNIARICFQGKRKQIGGVLKKQGQYTPEIIEYSLSAAKLKATARPQELSIDQWITLWQTLSK